MSESNQGRWILRTNPISRIFTSAKNTVWSLIEIAWWTLHNVLSSFARPQDIFDYKKISEASTNFGKWIWNIARSIASWFENISRDWHQDYKLWEYWPHFAPKWSNIIKQTWRLLGKLLKAPLHIAWTMAGWIWDVWESIRKWKMSWRRSDESMSKLKSWWR